MDVIDLPVVIGLHSIQKNVGSFVPCSITLWTLLTALAWCSLSAHPTNIWQMEFVYHVYMYPLAPFWPAHEQWIVIANASQPLKNLQAHASNIVLQMGYQ